MKESGLEKERRNDVFNVICTTHSMKLHAGVLAFRHSSALLDVLVNKSAARSLDNLGLVGPGVV